MQINSVGALAFLVVWGSSAAGVERAPNPNTDHESFLLFHDYCASCHGIRADGEGPMVAELRRKPRDLTRLSETLGSPLPVPKMIELIDGRRTRSHDTSDMPVWGKKLYERVPGPAVDLTRRGIIVAIIDYLQTIQRPPDSP